jgi:pimeloyl-ACP methyl ester carboxylesterase
MPGHGLTGPHPERRYHIPAQLEVVEAVARAKQLQRFVLGGNSMGGAIAWNYALVRPQQLAGIVLINSAGAPRDQISEGDQWENRNVQSPAQASGRQPLGFRIAATPFVRDVVAEMTPRWVVERSLRESIMVQESATDAVIDRYWELLRFPGNRQATIDRFASPRPPSRVGRMGEITVPTLILWGADDPLFPQPLGEAFARAIDGSRLILYPRIGHIPQEEAPDAVATDLSAFLDALPR